MAKPRSAAAQPPQAPSSAAAPLLLSLMLLLAPALGVPGEEMLQDTLKSAIVAFCTVAAAFLFLFARRHGSEGPRWHHLIWLPLLLMAYALGSMAWSHPYLGGVEAVRWFLFAVIAWLALNTFTREGLPTLAWCVHLGAVIASAWAVLQFWTGFALFPQGPNPASTFINRNFFAEFVVCTLPFAALLLARARESATVALLAASIGFVLTGILMTGTRGALIAMWLQLLVGLPLVAWRCRRQLAFPGWSRGVQAMAVAVLAGTVLVLGVIPTGNPKIVEEGYGVTALARGLHRARSIGPKDHSLNIRMVMWRATLAAIAARPLEGLGAGAWESEIPLYQEEGAQLETDYYVHNEFLQLVAEYGLVGWVFLLLLAAYLLRAAWRTWSDEGAEADAERPWRAVFLCSLLALMVVSNIGFPWRMAATGALFALCLGGLAASDARLGAGRLLASVPWPPLARRLALAASAACIVLAVFITQRAAQSEAKLVRAAQLALAITATGRPNDPGLREAKQSMLQLVREGIALHPHYRKITPIVADELARWGDWANATWIWESVLQSRPNVVAILTNAARGHDAMGHREQALAYLERARAIQPRAPAVRGLEVLLLARQGQEPRAMQRAQEAMDAGVVDQELVDSYFVLAWRARDYALAEKLLQQRMRDWPETRARGLVQLGVLHAEGYGDKRKALAAFQLAMKVARPQERDALLQQVPPEFRPQLTVAP
ncbi:MAG TPA: O-antigen ligase family protein [Ramlibacter sp.]